MEVDAFTLELKTVDLEVAAQYIVHFLDSYGDTLSATVSTRDWRSGSFCAVAPVASSTVALNALAAGLIDDPRYAVEDFLLHYMIRHLEGSHNKLWLSEYRSSASGGLSPQTDWFQYQPTMISRWDSGGWQANNAGVCVVLTAERAVQADRAREFMVDFLWGTRIACLTPLMPPMSSLPGPGELVSLEMLRNTIMGAEQVILPAYGGESYLVWRRQLIGG